MTGASRSAARGTRSRGPGEGGRGGVLETDLAQVEIRDFILNPPRGPFKAIVANPPYLRHHRLPQSTKAHLRLLAARMLGRPLDGRAGLHVYFLLTALQLLEQDGRLSFIVPADTCEGVFAPRLWSWIARHYCLEAVVTFAPQASPFPGVDTNPLIVMIRKAPPTSRLAWAKCLEAESGALRTWVQSGFSDAGGALAVTTRELSEALSTGFSRPAQDRPRTSPSLATSPR